MLTYELKKAPGVPLYEALYRCIREDILTGELAPGTYRIVIEIMDFRKTADYDLFDAYCYFEIKDRCTED